MATTFYVNLNGIAPPGSGSYGDNFNYYQLVNYFNPDMGISIGVARVYDVTFILRGNLSSLFSPINNVDLFLCCKLSSSGTFRFVGASTPVPGPIVIHKEGSYDNFISTANNGDVGHLYATNYNNSSFEFHNIAIICSTTDSGVKYFPASPTATFLYNSVYYTSYSCLNIKFKNCYIKSINGYLAITNFAGTLSLFGCTLIAPHINIGTSQTPRYNAIIYDCYFNGVIVIDGLHEIIADGNVATSAISMNSAAITSGCVPPEIIICRDDNSGSTFLENINSFALQNNWRYSNFFINDGISPTIRNNNDFNEDAWGSNTRIGPGFFSFNTADPAVFYINAGGSNTYPYSTAATGSTSFHSLRENIWAFLADSWVYLSSDITEVCTSAHVSNSNKVFNLKADPQISFRPKFYLNTENTEYTIFNAINVPNDVILEIKGIELIGVGRIFQVTTGEEYRSVVYLFNTFSEGHYSVLHKYNVYKIVNCIIKDCALDCSIYNSLIIWDKTLPSIGQGHTFIYNSFNIISSTIVSKGNRGNAFLHVRSEENSPISWKNVLFVTNTNIDEIYSGDPGVIVGAGGYVNATNTDYLLGYCFGNQQLNDFFIYNSYAPYSTVGSHCILNQDPLFAETETYTLTRNSPAVGAGNGVDGAVNIGWDQTIFEDYIPLAFSTELYKRDAVYHWADPTTYTTTLSNTCDLHNDVIVKLYMFDDATNVYKYTIIYGDNTYDEIIYDGISELTAIHKYDTPGVYSIECFITSTDGIIYSTDIKYMSVGEVENNIRYVDLSINTLGSPTTGYHLGTSAAPYGTNEFLRILKDGEVTVAPFTTHHASPNQIFKIKGRCELSIDNTLGSDPAIKIKSETRYLLDVWDSTLYGPWIMRISESRAYNNRVVADFTGAILRGGIIYNFTNGGGDYSCVYRFSKLYNMYVVCQGASSYIEMNLDCKTLNREAYAIGSTIYATNYINIKEI